MSAEKALPILESSGRPQKGKRGQSETRRSQTAATEKGVSPLIWLNLFCLDAPVVAVVWQDLLARTFAVRIEWPVRAMLFLTAWLIYLADRWFDSIALSSVHPQPVRQAFWQGRLKLFGALAALVALMNIALVRIAIDREMFFWGSLIGVVALLYLVTNHRWNRIWSILPLKECCVGFLFAAGTVTGLLPATVRHGALVRPLTVAFGLFGIVCSLNCISIAVWERDLDLAQGNVSIATSWPKVAGWLNGFAMVIVGGAIMVAVFDRRFVPLGVCVGLSAVLLRIIVALPVSRDERTALADLVLLTPLLLII